MRSPPWTATSSPHSTSAPRARSGPTSPAPPAIPPSPTTSCRRATFASSAPASPAAATSPRAAISSASAPISCATTGAASALSRWKTFPPTAPPRAISPDTPSRASPSCLPSPNFARAIASSSGSLTPKTTPTAKSPRSPASPPPASACFSSARAARWPSCFNRRARKSHDLRLLSSRRSSQGACRRPLAASRRAGTPLSRHNLHPLHAGDSHHAASLRRQGLRPHRIPDRRATCRSATALVASTAPPPQRRPRAGRAPHRRRTALRHRHHRCRRHRPHRHPLGLHLQQRRTCARVLLHGPPHQLGPRAAPPRHHSRSHPRRPRPLSLRRPPIARAIDVQSLLSIQRYRHLLREGRVRTITVQRCATALTGLLLLSPFAVAQSAATATPITTTASSSEIAALPDAPVPVASQSAPQASQPQTSAPQQSTPQTTPPAQGNQPSLSDLGFSQEQTQANAQLQARLNQRTHDLKVHQTLGLITLAPLVATIAVSGGATQKHDRNTPGATPVEPSSA